mgnify:FL=1
MKNKSQFLRTAENATEVQFAETAVFVEDFAGFNFLVNPFREGTHIFTCLSGEFICESPEEGDRFKHSRVLRPASDEEVEHYMSIVYPADEEEDCCINNQFYSDDHNECAVCGSKWL